jgi:hypothetical protein
LKLAGYVCKRRRSCSDRCFFGITQRGEIQIRFAATRRHVVTAVAILWAGFGLANFAGAATFTTLDFPGAFSTEAFGVNETGDIVGNYRDGAGNHGFVLSGGAFTSIDAPGAFSTRAMSIDQSGDVFGAFDDSVGEHRFLLSTDGIFTTIDDPDGAQGSRASATDTSGAIVGDFTDAEGASHGVVLKPNGTFATIDVPGAIDTLLHGIDASDEVVGSYFDGVTLHGFVAKDVTPANTEVSARRRRCRMRHGFYCCPFPFGRGLFCLPGRRHP